MDFKIKISKGNLTFFLMLLVLGISIFNIASSIILVTIVFLMLILNLFNAKKLTNNPIQEKIKHESYLWGMMILILFILQTVILGLDFDHFLSAMCIIAAIFIVILVENLMLGSLTFPFAFLKSLIWFDIIFSSYYIFCIILYGFPEDRDSVLGYVSSNYCAAILYLTFPIILYHLFDNKNINRKIKTQSYTALVLSIIVILISGSRTAFGVVLFMIVSLLLLKPNSIKERLKISFLIIAVIGGTFAAYLYIPSVTQLLDRAMLALGGTTVVDSDVRSLIWLHALNNFETYNHWIGSGSNLVYQYGTPAHNFAIELLLSCGYSGIILAAGCFGRTIYLSLKASDYYKRFFICQLIIASILVGCVQPFLTTAFTCGIIIWGSMFAICFDQR